MMPSGKTLYDEYQEYMRKQENCNVDDWENLDRMEQRAWDHMAEFVVSKGAVL